MLSNLDIAEWQRLCDEVTPGPWVNRYSPVRERMQFFQQLGTRFLPLGECYINDVDAEFICAAREALPALLDEVRRLEEENACLRKKVQWYTDNAPFYDDARKATEGE